MSRYDFTDPLIREMVAEHHKPKEVLSFEATGKVSTRDIVCRQCGQPWQCSARKELAAWTDGEFARVAGWMFKPKKRPESTT